MDEIKACLMRILRKAELMQLDGKTPTVAADASEIKKLAIMALKKLENLNDELIPPTDGRCRED